MLTRFAYRINLTLERYFPEQRLFLKSDATTRFIRLRPATQAVGACFLAIGLAWTILATSILLMDVISSGSSRDQIQRQTGLYEQRLNALSADRDLRVAEAAGAQDRFNLGLAEVSAMQGRLLASEDSRRELETGIDVIQNTLRRTIQERDQARAESSRMTLALAQQTGVGHSDLGRIRDTEQTLDLVSAALSDIARERDADDAMVAKAQAATDAVEKSKAEIEARNAVIFAKLEEALTISVAPLDKMFRDAGLNPNQLLDAVRSGYSGQGGPLSPISLSTMGLSGSPDETRANAILAGLDNLNLYRLAAFRVPLGLPLKTVFRMTSGFGFRNDPINGSGRMHEGQDFAGDYGSAIFATADGTVTYAGWENGYGRLIKISHAFGIETRYGHLSQIRVDVGQKVSRGDRIGDMGNSGRSTGTHLHYEVRLSGSAVNPMTFIRAANNVF
ncbi:MAG: peptidoglycan DD-metalloendopeptidase family protein [Pseudorhodobacter sp.]|nr:peptidoglycan DD-metalloendopeptidase family protein [Pseudorhodobacter sp.]